MQIIDKIVAKQHFIRKHMLTLIISSVFTLVAVLLFLIPVTIQKKCSFQLTNSKEVVIKNLPVLFARMAVGKIVELEPQLGNGEKFTVKVNDGSRSTGTCKGVILNTQGQMLHGEMNGSCYIQTKVYEMLF